VIEVHVSDSLKPSYGIAAGPDGNLWIPEYCDNKIGRIAPGWRG
jgi:streptogramin lyase